MINIRKSPVDSSKLNVNHFSWSEWLGSSRRWRLCKSTAFHHFSWFYNLWTPPEPQEILLLTCPWSGLCPGILSLSLPFPCYSATLYSQWNWPVLDLGWISPVSIFYLAGEVWWLCMASIELVRFFYLNSKGFS